MGGPPICHELTDHEILLQDQDCEPVFHNSGWLDYFLKMIEFNEEIAREFTHTFLDGEGQVKGLRFVVIEEWITEVIGLPAYGEKYPESKNARSTRAEFTQQGDPPLVIDK